jgi:hypothetical protein
MLATVLTALDRCRNGTTDRFEPINIPANESAKVVGEIFQFPTPMNVSHGNSSVVRRAPNMGLFFGNDDKEGNDKSKSETAVGGAQTGVVRAVSGSAKNGTVDLRLIFTFVLLCVGGMAYGLAC